jgi:DNA polymerase-3 subunit epsilon
MSAAPPKPPRRLRHAGWREVEFASLDFETTGLDYARDAVLSFGIVPIRGGRIVLRDAVHQLVEPHVAPSPTSMTIHGILPAELVGAPSMLEARQTLRSALAGRFLLAWYAEVEIAFLSRIFAMRSGSWRRRTVDARRLVLALEGRPGHTRETLAGTAARYGIPVTSPHQALDDALVTAQLFLVLASRLEEHGRSRVGDLIALCR